jgi:hypothetical protein
MDASGQVHSPATLPSGKELPVPIKLEPTDLVWMSWTREKSLALQGIKTLFLSCPAQSLVSILTTTV